VTIIKTSVQQQWNIVYKKTTPFTIESKQLVDDEIWYKVFAKNDVAKWIRLQDSKQWYEHKGIWVGWDGSHFDIHNELYTLMRLSWE